MANKQVFFLFPPIAGEEIYPRVQNFIKAFKNLKIPYKMAVKKKGEGYFTFLISIPGIIKESLESSYVIVFVSTISPFLILFYKIMFRKRVIIDHFATEESAFRSNIYILKMLEKISYKIAYLVFTHTESMKKVLVKYYNIDENKVIPIYCCVDTKLFSHKLSQKLKRSLDLDNKFVLIYHGLFHKWHGVSYFVKAFSKLLNKNSNVIALFIGANKSEALKLVPEIDKIPDEFLRFVPRIKDKDLPQYLSLGSIWIGRFNQNKFGKRAMSACMIEAMSVGLVPITSHSIENDKIISSGFNGVLIKEKDSESIVKALLYYINNKNKIASMSSMARETIVNNYSIINIESIFRKIFKYE